MSRETAPLIKTRRVFYIPGYDPIHPRRYRELYRSEGKDQSEISGYQLKLSPKEAGGNYGWQVDSVIDDVAVHSDVEVLVWSDIVRDSMANSIPATYWQLIRTAWVYIATGTLWRLMRLRKGPVIAALYPVAMLLVQLLLACVVFYVVGSVIGWTSRLIEEAVYGPVILWPRWFEETIIASILGGGTAFWLTLRWFKAKDAKFFAYYLMHDYAYSAASRGANPPELEARLAEFRTVIAQAMGSDVDEVLIVGHSSGAHLGVSILSDLIRSGEVPENGPLLSFLTLGQVVPMVSFLPDAQRLRTDLQYLSACDQLIWVDVTAPGDGCAFALCDPVSVSGVAPDNKRWPLVFSAAFTQSLSPARWKELRWKFFRLHFQYLCAFDRPRDYDYFQITAGPVDLGARYKNRAPSKSRIDYTVSKYTDVQ